MRAAPIVVVAALAELPAGSRGSPGSLGSAGPGGLAGAGEPADRAGAEPRVFLARRSGGRHAGLWELPGGKVEAGERPETALLRELGEELGIEAAILGPGRRYESLIEGQAFVFLVFPVDLGSRPPMLAVHDLCGYVPRSRLPDYELAPLDAEPLADWAKA